MVLRCSKCYRIMQMVMDTPLCPVCDADVIFELNSYVKDDIRRDKMSMKINVAEASARIQKVIESMTYITCPKCGEIKLVTEYYKYNTGGNKVTYWCSECIEYYIKHTSVGAN